MAYDREIEGRVGPLYTTATGFVETHGYAMDRVPDLSMESGLLVCTRCKGYTRWKDGWVSICLRCSENILYIRCTQWNSRVRPFKWYIKA